MQPAGIVREAHSAAEHYQLSTNLFFFVQLALVSRALESLENQNTGDQGKVNVPLQATKLCPQNIAGVSVGRNIPCSQSYQ